MTQTGGTINVGTLITGGAFSGTASLTGSDTIASIGSFVVSGGDFHLANTGSVQVTGPLSASNVTLSSGTIGVAGSIGASGSLIALSAGSGGIGLNGGTLSAPGGTLSVAAAGGGMTQTAGTINVGTLITGGAFSGTASLTGSDTIASIGSFVVSGGDFNLVNTGSVQVSGPLTATNVTLSSGSIGVAGSIGASGSLIALTGTTGIAETGAGTIAANSGSVSLSTGTLGAISLAGSLGAGSTIALSSGSGGIAQTGGVISVLPSGTLTLAASGGGVVQSGGAVINAGSVVSIGTVGGAVALLGTGNAIGTLGPLAGSGDVQVLDQPALTIASGAIVQSGSGGIYLQSANSGGITFGHNAELMTAGHTIGLRADALKNLGTPGATGIVTTGTVMAGTLVTGAGTFEVAPFTQGSLVTLGATPGSGLSLATLTGITADLIRVGAVTVPGSRAPTVTAGSIAVAGTFDMASTSPTPSGLELDATGNVGQTAPLLNVGTLSGSAASYILTHPSNTIGTIGPLTGTLGNIQITDASALTIAGSPAGQVLASQGNIYLQSSAPGGITFGANGTLAAPAPGSTIGLQANKITNLGTLGATGSVITGGGTFELAPNPGGTLVTLGSTPAGGLSLATLTGITADRIRIGAVTLPSGTLVTEAGSIAVSGAFDMTPSAPVRSTLELDAIGDVGQTAPLLNVGTLVGGAGSYTLTNAGNTIGTIGVASAGTLGSLRADGSLTGGITIVDAQNLTIAGDVVAGYGMLAPATASLSVSVPNADTLTVNGEAIAPGASATVSLSAGTIVIASAGPVLPVVAAGGAATLTAATISQTAGVISAGSITLNGSVSSGLSGGLVVATGGTIAVNSPTVTVGPGETVATVNLATDISFARDLTEAPSSTISANGNVSIGGLFTDLGGDMLAVGNITAGGIDLQSGLVISGDGLRIGTGSGVAGWAGSAAASASAFNQSGGVLASAGPVNIFASSFTQTAGTLAAGGTLGVTTSGDIDIGGTVSAAGATTGFMLLSTAGNATLSGLLAGPSGVSPAGNALQAPAGTLTIGAGAGSRFGVAGSVTAPTPVSGFSFIPPGVTLGVLTQLPSLLISPPAVGAAMPSTPSGVNTESGMITAPANVIPVALVGGSVEIDGTVVASNLGIYAKTLINEGVEGMVNAGTLTGSAGILAAGLTLSAATLAAGLTALNWSNSGATSIGWQSGSDVLGSATLLPSGGFNSVNTLADFRTTGNFGFSDAPYGAARTLTQTGTLQAGSGRPDMANADTLYVAVTGSLLVNGAIAAGVDDSLAASRPGGNVTLVALPVSIGDLTTQGNITVALQAADAVQPSVAAVPNGSQGGAVSLLSGSVVQTAGVINGGTVLIGNDAAGGTISLGGLIGDTAQAGVIVATTGSVALTARSVSVGSGETIAAVNTATDVTFSGDVTQQTASTIQANRDVTVGGQLSEFGGSLVAARDVGVGRLSQTSGIISAGRTLSVGSGSGSGIAGWAGSAATSGSFNQSGGVTVANNAVNVFSTNGFVQSGGTLAAGGTLGVTTSGTISIGGTVAAYGGSSGFMLLTTDGNATLLPGGLLAGSTSVPVDGADGNVIHGNALQAPAGSILISSGVSPGYGQAQPVGATTAIASGYTLTCPDCQIVPSTVLPAVPLLALPAAAAAAAVPSVGSVANGTTGTLTAPGNLISAVLIGGTIDIEGGLVASTLGLYARSLITEGAGGSVNAQTLTGTAGVLRNNVLAPGLTELGWSNAATIGWTFDAVNTLGEVSLTPASGVNAIATLSDFTATADFALTDTPFGASRLLTQTGSLQAGLALLSDKATTNWVTIAISGSLAAEGVIASGLNDGQSRAGGNVQISANDISSGGTIGAIPSNGNGGSLTLNAADTLTQTGGVLNGGNVSLSAGGRASLAAGQIVATTGAVGISAPTTSVNAGEDVAAINSATDVTFFGNVSQTGGYIGANRNLTVSGLLTEGGGTALAVGNISLGGLAESAGLVSAGGALSVGAGSGVAGFAGSNPASGSFSQTGGAVLSAGAANIFTTGAFQADGVVATGGTLGVTAASGITISGTVSASGGPSGFMLLTQAGDATLASSGLLGGPMVSVSGDVITGNALQAPAGTVVIAGGSGTQGFARAGSVSGGLSPVAGYGLTPPVNPPSVPLLASAAYAAPSGGAIPVVLIGGMVDIDRPITATTIGLYGKSLITEGSAGAITASTLTGSSGVLRNGVLPSGLTTLGWANAGAIGWTSGGLDTPGSVTLTPANAANTIGTLADFSATQGFALSTGSALTQTGVLAGDLAQSDSYGGSPGPVTVSVTANGPLTVNGVVASGSDDGNARPGGNLTLRTVGSSSNAIAINGSLVAVPASQGGNQGGIITIASAGAITENGAITTRGTLTGSAGGDVTLTNHVSVANVGAFNAAGQAFNLVDSSNLMLSGVIDANSVVIRGLGASVDLGPGNGFAGIGPGSPAPKNNDPFPAAGAPGVYLQGNNFNVLSNPAVSGRGVTNWTFALLGNGTVALGSFQEPNVKLFLDLSSGIATGLVNIAGLQVMYAPPPVKVTINLLGVVAGESGVNAASVSKIAPMKQNNYQVNGCPISSFNCVRFSTLTIPTINGLQDLDLGQLPFDFDDETLLPDVAEKDY